MPEASALVEAPGARVVCAGPQLHPIIASRPRLCEQGVDEPSTDALSPVIGRDEDHRDVTESPHGWSGPVVGEPLHTESHAHHITGGIGNEQEGARPVHLSASSFLLFRAQWQAAPSGGRQPYGDGGLDVLRPTAPYNHIAQR